MHSVSLICACALLALHIGVLFPDPIRQFPQVFIGLLAFPDYFWALWLVMPLVIGCTAVAEERNWAAAMVQFSLPGFAAPPSSPSNLFRP